MKQVTCPDCSTQYAANATACPNCGCPNDNYSAESNVEHNAQQPSSAKSATAQPQPTQPQQAVTIVQREKRDWANYIYECGLLMWHSFSRRYVKFSGRATRREYWSFVVVTYLFLWFPLALFVLLIPFIAVAVRRMHDINKSGWWILVPVASFFLYLKKSDEGENNYGKPSVDDI